ncbi:reverse transcriptase domain-containing protein [Tanacetum coccineum]
MSIRNPGEPTPFLSEEVTERVLALLLPPPSPFSPYSSPLPQIPSPPLPIPPPSPISPTYVEGSLGSRAAGIRQRDALPYALPSIRRKGQIIACRLGTVDGCCCIVHSEALSLRIRSMASEVEIGSEDPSYRDRLGLLRESAEPEAYQRRLGWGAVLRGLCYGCSYCAVFCSCIGYFVQPTKYYEYISASMALGNWHQEEGTQGTTRTRPSPRLPPPVTTTPYRSQDPTTPFCTGAQLQAMIDEGVTAVLAARATTRNGDDSHTSGTGARRNERTVRECTYQDFMKCQPVFFRGTEEVVNLTQWFERMETVFRISNCTVENQVKFATCTLMGTALTWWNSHARTVTNDVASWGTLKVQGTDVVAYNQRFQELALLSDRMFPEEADKIERYVGGMPDLIYSSVVASKPKTMQEAIEMATDLMDRRINTLAENKRKLEDTPRNNQTYQQNKRQNTGRAYAAGNGDRKPYEGAKPRCPKCNFNHYGPCTPKCTNCKKLGHLAKDCRSRPATANNNNRNKLFNNNKPRTSGATAPVEDQKAWNW